MTWLKVDDAFCEGPKARDLSDSALAMWLRVGCWAQRAENLHFRGFVPRKALARIAGKSPSEAEEIARELVEANAYGSKEHGLWEPREDGWQIHDWDDYQPPPQALTKSEAASLAGKRSAEVRRERNGTAQPNRQPERTLNELESFESRSTERRSESGSVERSRTPRTPDPIPTRSRPDPGMPASQLSGNARAGGRAGDPPNTQEPLGAPVSRLETPQATTPHPDQDPPVSVAPRGQRLVDRLVTAPRDPGQPPTPRKDPLNQRIAFGQWFPSQQWLDWHKEMGITAAKYDQTMAEARDKLTGSHDIELWDIKILKFFEVAAKNTGPNATFHRRAVVEDGHHDKNYERQAEIIRKRMENHG